MTIQLTLAIKFISSKVNEEERMMHSKSDNVEIMINDTEDEVIEGHLQYLFPRYHISLEKLIKSSDFVFDCVNLFYYKCHKINFKLGGSQIDSPDWMRNKRAKINLKKRIINALIILQYLH